MTDSDRRPTLWCYPLTGIAYNDCLTGSLRAAGVEVQEGVWSGRWILGSVRAGDAVLFNWPSFQYKVGGGNLLSRMLACLRYAVLLLIIRTKGAKIAWIAHNLLPHSRSRPAWLDVLMRHVTTALSSVVFAHGKANCQAVARRFPLAASKIVEITHGNFIDRYPRGQTRETARQALNLPPEALVLLSFGAILPYKGYHQVPPALAKLSAADVHYVVAGPAPDEAYLEELRELAAANLPGKAHFFPGYVPDEQVQTFLAACDVMLMPYVDSLTSGTALLALSFGRPLLAPRTGFLDELLGDRGGVLYAASEAEGLSRAMAQVTKRSFDESDLLDLARSQGWGSTARKIALHLGLKVRPR